MLSFREQLPQLWQHFSDKGVESHMFASQWFLTLFTARFPLYFVFHILDVFLLQGVDTLFQVALALLMSWLEGTFPSTSACDVDKPTASPFVFTAKSDIWLPAYDAEHAQGGFTSEASSLASLLQ
ncbi:unnamed protein product [Timema podura]|uniref:Rab-GAP TBC domain-containing protein n=1 Tax=Timema podura TaxID=61482 RepID=A0ABN7P9P7_TIMPD|nr:unnamed protein product [Timema podura]